MEEKGIISPVLEIECKYLNMMYFDDIATIHVSFDKYSSVRFTCSYEIYNQDSILCTTGTSKHCFINKDGKPINLKKSYPEFDQVFKKFVK